MKKRIKNRNTKIEKLGLELISPDDLILYRSTINAPFSIQDIVVNVRIALKLGTHCYICGAKQIKRIQ